MISVFEWRVVSALRLVLTTFVSAFLFTGLAGAQDSLPMRKAEETLPAPSAGNALRETPVPLVNAQGDRLPESEISVSQEVSAVPKKFQYAFRLGLRAVYDDNIYLRSTDTVGDYYFSIEPGVTVGYGDIVGSDQNFIRLDYAPSVFLYAQNSAANSSQHVIRLDGAYHFPRLNLTLTQEIQFLDGTQYNNGSLNPGSIPSANLDAGAATSVNTFNTRANFSCDLTGKTFLSGGLQHTANQYDGSLIDTQSTQGNVYLNYNYSPKLTVGLGGTLGYNWVASSTPNQTFEQINARITYQATGKISLEASGGVEFRQFGNSTGTYISPVYEVSVSYQPFDGTSLSLSGNRRTEISAVLAGQDYASTNFNLSVRQRFFQRVYLSIALGYQNLSYFNTVDNGNASRNDDYYYFQPAVDYTLTRFWTMGAFYLHRRNETSATSFGFDDNQFGLRTSLTF